MTSERALPASQTLSRGIRIIEVLAQAREPMSIDATARELGVHRSIAYRLVRTLETHRIVVRDAAGLLTLGPRLAALAAGVAHDLQAAALPELTAMANELGMTCFLSVLDGGECVTLVSVEPRHTAAAVAHRPGSRHPLALGAPGRAILAALPPEEWPDDPDLVAALRTIREDGYATSNDEVIPGLRALAVPVALPGRPPAALAAIYVSSALRPSTIAERLRPAAQSVVDAVD